MTVSEAEWGCFYETLCFHSTTYRESDNCIALTLTIYKDILFGDNQTIYKDILFRDNHSIQLRHDIWSERSLIDFVNALYSANLYVKLTAMTRRNFIYKFLLFGLKTT